MLLHDLNQCAYIDVIQLVCRQINEGLRVHQFHVVLPHELELHNHYVVFDVLKVEVLAQIDSRGLF